MNRDLYTMEVIAVARYQDRLREAEHARLLRRLQDGRAGMLRRACATILIVSGAKLTRMGQQLRPAPAARLVAEHARRR